MTVARSAGIGAVIRCPGLWRDTSQPYEAEVMGGQNDIYVLAPERSEGVVRRFLDTFVPHRSQGAMDYSFPLYAENPVATFTEPIEAIRYAADHPLEQQVLYFGN